MIELYLVKMFYGLEKYGVYDWEYYDYVRFLFIYVLWFLSWIGFLVEIFGSDWCFDKVYWKMLFWYVCFKFSIDGIVEVLLCY